MILGGAYMKSIFKISLCLTFIVLILTGCKKKELEITLIGNSSTGYSWNYEVDKEGIVEINHHLDASGCEDKTGCDEKNIYTIKGLKPGKVTVTFNYDFIVPEESYQGKEAVYEIVVDEKLKLKETHSGSYFESEN